MLGASLQLTNKLQARHVSLTEITCAVAVGSCILVFSLPRMSSVVSLICADESFMSCILFSFAKWLHCCLEECYGVLLTRLPCMSRL